MINKVYNMPKKMAKEEFIQRSINLHGDKYCYEEVVYINNNTHVDIICKTHGVFKCKPANHVHLGRGCPKCGFDYVSKLKRDKGELDFFNNAQTKFKGKFDYSKSKYTNSVTKLIIGCPVHGDFLTTPYSHIFSEHGCPKCAKIVVANKQKLTAKSFSERVSYLKDWIFDLDTFISHKDNISGYCIKHDTKFEVKVKNVLSFESGCPLCKNGGYKRHLKGTFYLLSVNDDVIKFGITNKFKDRLRDINKHSTTRCKLLHKFEFDDGAIPDDFESLILKDVTIPKGVISRELLPNGFTETTYSTYLPIILDKLQEYLKTFDGSLTIDTR